MVDGQVSQASRDRDGGLVKSALREYGVLQEYPFIAMDKPYKIENLCSLPTPFTAALLPFPNRNGNLKF